MVKEKTIFQSAVERGVSRRDFLKMCTALTATMGLHFSQTDKVVKAMEEKEKLPVVWLQFQDCTGCSEALIRATNPSATTLLLDMISLEYSELLSAAAGHQAKEALYDVIKNYKGKYIVVVEGSIPKDPEYCMIAGKSPLDIYQDAAKDALAVVAVGSCAAWGGIAGAKPNPTNARPVGDFSIGKVPLILVPGCPPIPDVIVGVLAHYLTFETLPELDRFGRPNAFFKHRLHDKCNRRAFFDAGLFVEAFDDHGSKNGWCLYKVGCKGPTTYSACMEMRWNGGTSNPILSGNTCIGCTEDGFWDHGPLYERSANIPGTQTAVNPEKIGAVLAGATAVGVVAHGVGTAIKKKYDDKRNPHEE